MRRFFALVLAAILLAVTWARGEVAPADPRGGLRITPLPLPADCCTDGPLRLESAWVLTSRHGTFGGYSALLSTEPGRLLALSDRGYFVDFAKPDQAGAPARFGATLSDPGELKANRDVESVAWDPVTRRIWLAQEGRDAISRQRLDMTREAFREVPEWRAWSSNSGPESMVRLPDGRFIALCECRTTWLGGNRHPAYLYDGDPTDDRAGQRFELAGIAGYRPTDIALLPDGRVMILARRLLWPIPARFAMKVMIADPREIAAGKVWQAQEIADLSAPWPVDNFEGLTVGRDRQGRLIAWMISDDNAAVSQRVLLLKVVVDEAALGPASAAGSKKAPG